MNISILGCGNWGSVFGIMQYKNGHSIKIWEFDKQRAEYINRTRTNEPFLVGHKIPEEIEITWNIESVIRNCDLLVFAVPSQVLPEVVEQVKRIEGKNECYLSLTKGINIELLKRPSELINELAAPDKRTWVLSGPCIANELIRGEPTAVVLVGPDRKVTQELQIRLTTENLRIYLSDDIIGVELGAAVKNVIALACGISDGLGYGNNAKGALITRGIVELQRLGVRMGAKPTTFWGLSGLGDLVTTSFSEESRNHRFGVKIAGGKTVEEIKKEIVMVAEGVPTCQAVKKLMQKFKTEMPICNAVYKIIFENIPPEQALKELMTRPLKDE
ncbi:MAG TPA: NAD(P)-dependent glycerol-3-phosphate dehydrogenase [candidate division WOR-3 bacterium]|uniref:Glycerol-3-phosphate dehydrogenase [NAD(P)+] n=1 Tax=candidate division WOR-3 bacterium TaxID=2052148 RepID=A0A9C9K0S1_UNCW3|nr:NAD(P)-dependent glycerol-3-phosphate dehydrogenase [candidate division WOR-3 bacterium]